MTWLAASPPAAVAHRSASGQPQHSDSIIRQFALMNDSNTSRHDVPLPGSWAHDEYNSTSGHCSHDSKLFPFELRLIWGLIVTPATFKASDSEVENNLTRPHSPDVSYQIQFESVRQFWKNIFINVNEWRTYGRKDGQPGQQTHFISDKITQQTSKTARR